jgi:hypothetical protein
MADNHLNDHLMTAFFCCCCCCNKNLLKRNRKFINDRVIFKPFLFSSIFATFISINLNPLLIFSFTFNLPFTYFFTGIEKVISMTVDK